VTSSCRLARDDVPRLPHVSRLTLGARAYLAVETGSGPIVVLSGLNGRISLESMQNRPVVLLMNLKPAKSASPSPVPRFCLQYV
jgi:hypothetical protein